MKRRIAIALEPPLMQHGGVEVLIQGLLEGLADHYEIVLVSGDSSPEEIPAPYRDFIVDHVYLQGCPVTYLAARKLAKELQAKNVELVHFNLGGVYTFGGRLWGRSPVVACSRLGIPTLTTVHLVEATLEGFCGPQKPRWFKRALWPFAWLSRLQTLLHAKQEIAVSCHDKERMQRWFRPWRDRISHLYHSRIKEENERPVHLSQREPILLSVGTIGLRKGQPFLIRAFARIAQAHPGWRLILVGRGSDASTRIVQEEIAQAGLGDRLVWTGPLPTEEIVDLMYRASLFVMPSLEEGLGLSLQEALYRGCPAVGSRVGGIPELIDDQSNGLLVPPGDVEALAEALDTVLSDEVLRHRLAAQARPSVIRKEMTHPQMVENYRCIYDAWLTK
ncbi:MAG: glycosyltransferase family 4 protein [Verrucomicrobia bacterium]|nr:glycosyltransferase family 4 protein [Verrucomicrobiota bacterium]